MRSLTAILTALSIYVLLASSCTLQRKHYSNGFHVEWCKYKKWSIDTITSTSFISQDQNPPLQPRHKCATTTKTEGTQPDLSKSMASPKKTLPVRSTHLPRSISAGDPQQNHSYAEETHPNRIATLSFGISVLAVSGFIVSLIFGWGLYLIFLLLSIPAFILGLIGLKQIRKEPEAYDHVWYTWVGIWLGALELVALIFFITFFVLYTFFF